MPALRRAWRTALDIARLPAWEAGLWLVPWVFVVRSSPYAFGFLFLHALIGFVVVLPAVFTVSAWSEPARAAWARRLVRTGVLALATAWLAVLVLWPYESLGLVRNDTASAQAAGVCLPFVVVVALRTVAIIEELVTIAIEAGRGCARRSRRRRAAPSP